MTMTAVDVKHRLDLLHTERAIALETPLRDDAAYMADLEQEILATREAYVGSVVLEIARLREELGGALMG